MNRVDWLKLCINVSLKAGQEIMDVYNSPIEVDEKADNSPLTEADKRSHEVIFEALQTTGLPILSEEGDHADFSQRRTWDRFWLIDPLDGTKEFIKKNGEFTVNIALIEQGKPTMGIIYVPVSQELYFSDKEAYKIESFISPLENFQEIMDMSQQLPLPTEKDSFVVVGSRSHMTQETSDFITDQESIHGKIDIVAKGSSLKLCLIAEGLADAYPRFAPTMEWDIGAGQAIIEASGAQVIDWETKQPMRYNKENLLNNWFLASRN